MSIREYRKICRYKDITLWYDISTLNGAPYDTRADLQVLYHKGLKKISSLKKTRIIFSSFLVWACEKYYWYRSPIKGSESTTGIVFAKVEIRPLVSFAGSNFA